MRLPATAVEVGRIEDKTAMTKTQTVGNGIKNLIANVPLALLALPASYGAARFSEKVYQEPVNWILGGAFESAYTGAIFFAQKKSKRIFAITVASAVICGVIYNTLWAATTDNLLANQIFQIRWLIALIHGAPLSVLAFAYAMLMHKTSDAVEEAVSTPILPVVDTTLVEAERKEKEEALSTLNQTRTELDRVLENGNKQLVALQGENERLQTALIEQSVGQEIQQIAAPVINSDTRYEQIAALRAQGVKWEDVAQQLGIGASTARKIFNEGRN
jgi:hypothetical protein